MKAPLAACGLMLLHVSNRAAAEPPVAPMPTDERLVVTTDGSTLTSPALGGARGGGGSVTWLHARGSDLSFGGGAEYQQIAKAHWTVASVVGALRVGDSDPQSGADATHLYGEAHAGGGNTGTRPFHYSVLAAGFLRSLTQELSLQLEMRRIDVDVEHGNLPKIGLSYRAAPRLLLSASYALTAGGNLGARLGSARLDYVGRTWNAILGASGGRGAPSGVINLVGQAPGPGLTLAEGFAGFGVRYTRLEWLLLGDYQDLSGTKHAIVTLSCTVHLRPEGRDGG